MPDEHGELDAFRSILLWTCTCLCLELAVAVAVLWWFA